MKRWFNRLIDEIWEWDDQTQCGTWRHPVTGAFHNDSKHTLELVLAEHSAREIYPTWAIPPELRTPEGL